MVTVRPYQHALPVVGGRAAKLNQPASAAASDYRPIHVSSYDRKGRDFYATPNWVTEALLQRFQFRGPPYLPSTATKWSRRTSPTAGLALRVSISWRAGLSEMDAAALLQTLPTVRLQFMRHSRDHRRRCSTFCVTFLPSPLRCRANSRSWYAYNGLRESASPR
jgi:hypothetical protein